MGFKFMSEIKKEVRFLSYDTGIHIHSCPVVQYKNLGEFYFFRVPYIWRTCHLFLNFKKTENNWQLSRLNQHIGPPAGRLVMWK